MVLHQVGPLLDRREGQAELAVLDVVPAGAHADLDPSAAHLVDRRHDLGEAARMAERHRRDEHAQADPIGVTGEAGHDRPGVRGRLPGRTREARVVVGAEEGLDAVRLGALGDRDVVAVAEALLRLEHEGEAHRVLLLSSMIVNVDTIVRGSMIVHMTRSTMPVEVAAPATPRTTRSTVAKAAIIADFRASMAELKCIGSERLVRQGISMTQLHVMHLLDHHGEMPMSRLAEMLDVSLSNGTGLIDRVEERGFVERIRVPSDRRMVMVRLTPAGRQMLDEIETIREQILRRVLDKLDTRQLTGVATAMADLRECGRSHLHRDRRPPSRQPSPREGLTHGTIPR